MRLGTLCSIFLVAFSFNVTHASEATYRLLFESDWTNTSHPNAYPNNAHFSGLIGATHSGGVTFWERGGLASAGIEAMAELGSTVPLRLEVMDAIAEGTAATVESAGGLNAPGMRQHEFTVSSEFPLLTIVSMIAPSPDWFVGVSGLDLRANGQWVDTLSFDLRNYDAGTDSGTDFTSPNMDTNPAEPISVLGSPLDGLPPIGRFTITQISNSAALCDFSGDGECSIDDLDLLLAVGPIQNGLLVEYGVNNQFDLNGDGTINLDDRNDWLVGAAAENGLAGPYSPADANLDGAVDGADFLVWNSNKFSNALAASSGDFNGDGVVDAVDFTIWNTDKFTTADLNAVPEPSSGMAAIVGLAVLFWRRQMKQPN